MKARSLGILPAIFVLFVLGCSGETGGSGSSGMGGSSDTGAGGAATTSGSGTSGSGTSGSGMMTGTGGATGSGGSAGVGGSSGQGGMGGSTPVCGKTDVGEPDDTEMTAENIGPLNCPDAAGGQLIGVLSSADDADWYVYSGKDLLTCTPDPTQGLTIAANGVRLCAFVECTGGTATTITCPAGTINATSPDNRAGCCGNDLFTIQLDCVNTSSDDANVYLRVDTPTGEGACSEYTLSYHY